MDMGASIILYSKKLQYAVDNTHNNVYKYNHISMCETAWQNTYSNGMMKKMSSIRSAMVSHS